MKVNVIKKEIQNIDRLLSRSGNCRSRFSHLFYSRKELEMLSRLLKTFGMKEVKEVVDAYQCNGDMAKNQKASSFNEAER